MKRCLKAQATNDSLKLACKEIAPCTENQALQGFRDQSFKHGCLSHLQIHWAVGATCRYTRLLEPPADTQGCWSHLQIHRWVGGKRGRVAIAHSLCFCRVWELCMYVDMHRKIMYLWTGTTSGGVHLGMLLISFVSLAGYLVSLAGYLVSI